MVKSNIMLEILYNDIFDLYLKNVNDDLLIKYKLLQESDLSIDTFSFYSSVSAVFSSKIEGEEIELDSYIKHKRYGIEFLPDYTRKIDDLYDAYQFAKSNTCNRENIEIAHSLITTHILPKHKQGKIRKDKMYVITDNGKIEYIAADPNIVEEELNKFYNDLCTLISSELSVQEVFYYASLLHLVFVKIHPFNDGNGRTARLIEKWFLAEKLQEKAWLIQSEKYYYLNHALYYQNIRKLGLEYDELDYSKAENFLEMLPQSLILQ